MGHPPFVIGEIDVPLVSPPFRSGHNSHVDPAFDFPEHYLMIINPMQTGCVGKQ